MVVRRRPLQFVVAIVLAVLPSLTSVPATASAGRPDAGDFHAFARDRGDGWSPQEASYDPQANGWCAEGEHGDPDDVPSLDIVVSQAFLDCETGLWFFVATTADTWATSALDAYFVLLDIDANGSTGCDGAERVVVAFQDSDGFLVGFILDTPSCDEASWSVILDVYVERTAPNDIYVALPHWAIGSPSLMGWSLGLAPLGADWTDWAPDTSFYPITIDDPCAPSGSRWAAIAPSPGTEPRWAAASTSLSAAGLAAVERGHGVVSFTGDPVTGAAALRAAGVEATIVADRQWDLAEVPDDPVFPDQWELPDIGAPAAWDTTKGSNQVVVAVLDTGIDANSPEFSGKLVGGYDASTGTALGGGNSDAVGHGTAVAGVAAARTDNGTGVASVGWNLAIMPIKLGEDVTTSAIATGIRHARLSGADVMNLSFGSFCPDASIEAELEAARADGVLAVAAAGNMALNGNPVVYPAAHPSTFAVGATTIGRTRASYSTTGPYVDLAAPGGDGDELITVLQQGGGFAEVAGTSFAAPLVAGAAGLARSVEPLLTPSAIEDLLEVTAHDLGPAGKDHAFGWGLLDVATAVEVVALVDRLAGASRYATAAAIAADGWPGTAPHVFIATGRAFPDALVVGALAARRPGPLLLVNGCQLPAVTRDALQRLSPGAVTVAGGTGAVCEAVVQQIRDLTGATVERVEGASRYHTGASLARAGWDTAATLYLASGADFADGLTGGVRAGRADAPLALTRPCELPQPTSALIDDLDVSAVVVLGGPAAVCEAVLDALRARGLSVTRLFGPTRYATAAAIATQDWPAGGQWPAAVGTGFADGLAIGPWAVLRDRPLLLLQPCGVHSSVASAAGSRQADRVAVAGGPAAVCDRAVWTFGELAL